MENINILLNVFLASAAVLFIAIVLNIIHDIYQKYKNNNKS